MGNSNSKKPQDLLTIEAIDYFDYGSGSSTIRYLEETASNFLPINIEPGVTPSSFNYDHKEKSMFNDLSSDDEKKNRRIKSKSVRFCSPIIPGELIARQPSPNTFSFGHGKRTKHVCNIKRCCITPNEGKTKQLTVRPNTTESEEIPSLYDKREVKSMYQIVIPLFCSPTKTPFNPTRLPQLNYYQIVDTLVKWTGKKPNEIIFDSFLDELTGRNLKSAMIGKSDVVCIVLIENGGLLGLYNGNILSDKNVNDSEDFFMFVRCFNGLTRVDRKNESEQRSILFGDDFVIGIFNAFVLNNYGYLERNQQIISTYNVNLAEFQTLSLDGMTIDRFLCISLL